MPEKQSSSVDLPCLALPYEDRRARINVFLCGLLTSCGALMFGWNDQPFDFSDHGSRLEV